MHDAYVIIEDREKKLLAAKEETDRILLELQNTLGQVQKLKLQQDGDYFLTTLLIHPLIVNEATGSKIKIDFLIRQKKACMQNYDITMKISGRFQYMEVRILRQEKPFI